MIGTLEQIRKDMEHGVYDFTVNERRWLKSQLIIWT